MCNRIVQDGQVVKPGQKVKILMRGPGGTFVIEFDGAVFSGAAREYNKKYWLGREKAEEVIVPGVTKYGEKNKQTGGQSFETVPEGSKMLGFLLPKPPGKDYRLLKVLTTDGGPTRTEMFGNDRTPVFEPPLPDALGEIETELETPAKYKARQPSGPTQGDLFG